MMNSLNFRRFSNIVFASLGIYLIMVALLPNLSPGAAFFDGGKDLFMDFFNSVRDAAQGSAAYTERHIIYPPMANAFFWLCAKITPLAYTQTDFANRYTWTEYPVLIALVLCFFLVLFAALFLLLYQTANGSKKHRLRFAATFSFCLPVVYMIERGNLLFLAFLSLFIFAKTYHSKNPLQKEIGLLCLAFSFSLKLYTILFAWLLVPRKEYAALLRLSLYCILLLLLPSFLFGGPRILLVLVQNILQFSLGTSYTVSSFVHLKSLLSLFSLLLFFIFLLFFFLTTARTTDAYTCLTAGTLVFISFPALTSVYAWSFFIVPLSFAFAKENANFADRRHLFLLLPFLYYPISLPFPVTINTILAYLATAILAVYAVLDIIAFRKKGKERTRL